MGGFDNLEAAEFRVAAWADAGEYFGSARVVDIHGTWNAPVDTLGACTIGEERLAVFIELMSP